MGARSYAGRTAAERTAERRARLLRAVAVVLDQRGEARATMTGVCAEAGLTERYFYESFTGLDEALRATLDDVAERILGLVLRVVEETPGLAGARVRAAMQALVDLVVSDPVAVRVAVVHAAGSPVLRERRDVLVGTFADAVAAEAAALHGPAAWPPARAHVHARVLVAGLSDLVAAFTSGRTDLDPDDLVDAATDLFDAVMRRPTA